VLPPTAAGLSFLTIADWGGIESPPYFRSAQKACAYGMGRVASGIGSKFVVALGDNFYHHGIDGTEYVARFQQTFEDVYTANSLQTPWYVIAGNHDYAGNVSAQVAYTRLSKRWRYPDLYHGFVQPIPGTSMTFELILIDTIVLDTDGYAMTEQWEWLERRLETSQADYLWVGGHYPVWSVCEHGPTMTLVARLRPLLERYNVTGYMSGHDHCQQYLDEGRGPHYIVTGTGTECCYSASNRHAVPKGALKWHHSAQHSHGAIGGFVSFTITNQSMTATFYDQDGDRLYVTPGMVPRARAKAHKRDPDFR